MEPISYQQNHWSSLPPVAGRRRPALVTTIGVMSIVVAGLSLIGCLIVTGWTFSMYAMSFVSANASQSSVASSNVSPTPIVVLPTPTELKQNIVPQTMPTADQMRYASGLTQGEINNLIQTVRTQEPRVNQAQIATLTRVLQTGTPKVVDPRTAYAGINMVYLDSDGTLMVQGSVGWLWVDSNGTVTQQFNRSLERMRLTPLPVALSIGELVLSLILAIYLLVIGIFTLREHRRAATLYWIYAATKLPLAILAFTTLVWLSRDFEAGMNSLGGAGVNPFSDFLLVITGLAAIYPAALLLVLGFTNTCELFGDGTAAT